VVRGTPASRVRPAPSGVLPNLLIIGAAKAGTTSLHEYLSCHPDVFMTQPKEQKFFNRPDWREALESYRAHFPADKPVRGESSPVYSMHPWAPSVPERIHETVPEARIVYMVRDPVERLVAQYVEFFAMGLEDATLERALADYDKPSNVYAMSSRYAYQLDLYREHFPDSQLLVVDQRDLLRSRRETMREIFRFLGVDSDWVSPEWDRVHNQRAGGKVRLNATGRWLQQHNVLQRLRRVSHVLPDGLRERTKLLVADRVEVSPVLHDGLRGELEHYLRDDADRLRAYTGKAFEHWSV
jgi:hypothetical protein